MDEDGRWMARALALAARGEGRVSPNPLVGAVVVRAGRAIGEGWHRRFGGAHAEVEALAHAGPRARGATLYVTLEPCNHRGKTAPCVEAVLRSGVARVVAAMRDPNPLVRGGGLAALARAGVEVATGLLVEQARRQNESFLRHARSGRPLVRWKCAASLDGRIADAEGRSRWISGPEARRWAQALRRWCDAVLVGSNTVLRDDPRLTLRDGRGPVKAIARAVVDGRLRTSADARLLRARGGPVLVYALRCAPERRARRLEEAGAEVVRVEAGRDGRPDLRRVLEDLGRRGVGRLLVEGGGEVAASLLRARLVDRVSLVLAPLLIGGDGVPAVGALRLPGGLGAAPRVRVVTLGRLGRDLHVEADLERRA